MKTWTILRAATGVVAVAVEAGLWAGHAGSSLVALSTDIARARRERRGTFMICPRGHETSTEGVFECTCGWVYEGVIWFCPNPECPSPVTAHAECAVCGCSVRNPWRWGRP